MIIKSAHQQKKDASSCIALMNRKDGLNYERYSVTLKMYESFGMPVS
jgi:hypothetical protein